MIKKLLIWLFTPNYPKIKLNIDINKEGYTLFTMKTKKGWKVQYYTCRVEMLPSSPDFHEVKILTEEKMLNEILKEE